MSLNHHAQVWIVEGKLFRWKIHWLCPDKQEALPGKVIERWFETWMEAREWIRDFERCDHIWTVPASRAACNALVVHHKLINNVILKNAENSALDRSLMTGYEPAIILDDVINSIQEFSDVEVEVVL